MVEKPSGKEAWGQGIHKEASLNFEKHLRACAWYFHNFDSTRQSPIGACHRNYQLPDSAGEDLVGIKLGEVIHKWRCHRCASYLLGPTNKSKLEKLGYTETSAEAGVDKYKKGGRARQDNKWSKIEKVLEWIHGKFGHINLGQRTENPDDFPIELLDGLNYEHIGRICADLRAGCLVPGRPGDQDYDMHMKKNDSNELF